MPNEAYAKSVVAQVMRGPLMWRWWSWLGLGDSRKRWIWEGNKSALIWWLSGGWTWNGIFDIVIPRMFGLAKLKRGALGGSADEG